MRFYLQHYKRSMKGAGGKPKSLESYEKPRGSLSTFRGASYQRKKDWDFCKLAGRTGGGGNNRWHISQFVPLSFSLFSKWMLNVRKFFLLRASNIIFIFFLCFVSPPIHFPPPPAICTPSLFTYIPFRCKTFLFACFFALFFSFLHLLPRRSRYHPSIPGETCPK